MSESVLTAGFLPMGATAAFAASSCFVPASGVSEEAVQLHDYAAEISERFESSQALFGDKMRLLSELHELAEECVEDDWDGYGAEAVNAAVLARAEAFVRALPDDLPLPEISAEPDGAIAFDWMPLSTKTFSLSVSRSDRLAYAWIDGTDRGHAAVKFEGMEIPPRVLTELERLTRHAAPFWSA
ncbi:MAG: hypothetical protein ACLFUF_05310 [Opitutales bacterium]